MLTGIRTSRLRDAREKIVPIKLKESIVSTHQTMEIFFLEKPRDFSKIKVATFLKIFENHGKWKSTMENPRKSGFTENSLKNEVLQERLSLSLLLSISSSF